ncbi:MAG: MscS Mechanosensitive ion channel, partial [Deltaproteobacteria bacterium]|nr:MscS Mechanosensitive ion channel [Deltaproteobacteria bacterium]
MFADILNRGFYHNRVSEYLLCLAILAGGVLAVKVLQALVTRRMKARAEAAPARLDDFVIERIRKTGIPLAFLGIVEASLRVLTLTPRVERIVDMAGIVLMAIISTLFAVALVRFGVQEYIRKQGEDASRHRALKGVTTLAMGLAWIIGVLFMLDNLGFKISTVVAGLGIGGIAVALAAQAVLGDLFAYFTILFDRPFEIGDYIVVGEHMGTIERFGIKTTRIAGLGGEQIIVSNKDLTDSRVRNFKRMTRRRAVFRLGVTYQTPAAILKEIPGIIADIFRELEGAALERAHFLSFGDFSLIFEIVYYVDGNDYTKYMHIQQAANLRIYDEF